MATRQNRDFVMTVKLTEEMREKLIAVSDLIGQSPATVASFAIGQYVSLQHASLTASFTHSKALIDAVGGQLGDLLSRLAPDLPDPDQVVDIAP